VIKKRAVVLRRSCEGGTAPVLEKGITEQRKTTEPLKGYAGGGKERGDKAKGRRGGFQRKAVNTKKITQRAPGPSQETEKRKKKTGRSGRGREEKLGKNRP